MVRPPHVDFDRMNEIIADAQLALAGSGGDEILLDELMRHGRRMALWLVRTKGWYLPNGGSEEDLVQEGMRGFIEAVRKWRPEAGLFTSLAKISVDRDIWEAVKWATRVCRKGQATAASLDEAALRNKYNQAEIESGDRLERWRLPDGSGVARDPAEILIDDDAAELMQACLNIMSATERPVFLRCILNREPYLKVAADMKRTPKAVDNAAQRAKRKLHRLMRRLVVDPKVAEETRLLISRMIQRSEATAAAREVAAAEQTGD